MLNIENVSLTIGAYTLLDNISLQLNEGKIYGLLGPNGAGKTTLFKSMLGLTAYSGKITSDNQLLSSRDFGSLIEYPAFYNNLTVVENLQLHSQYLEIQQPDIQSSLEQVDLWGARKKKFSQLSLGMKQRLGIARAFLGTPKYLLLDEPTNGLDPMGIKEIRILLKDKLKSPQHCILVSSHNLTEIAAIADELIFIHGGQIIKTMQNTFENEQDLEKLYEDIMISCQKEGA
ncbi:ATP-binding cassette domain-containing protein [Viridibacillus sp. YIM B01967]|uniref:ATP-binding cassette domain-containing protein n=1 Tax=Viridibacillus soli TaxID=2798301 RepID=A0ABS1HAN9_9BACL|nr:ATP-binding cassette domain-containing protein [Viridibacillus soli]MBK3496508.1 ATP-binding cassette domain-containing protein [Viridibacillus soli]